MAQRRTFDYSDLSEVDLAPLPPTKIQISVLDVVPAVWSVHFVEPKKDKIKKKPRPSLNHGEMSHAEVARRTEKALKRNEQREAEREARRIRLAEAKAARLRGEAPPARVRNRHDKKRKPTQSPAPSEKPKEKKTPRRDRKRPSAVVKQEPVEETRLPPKEPDHLEQAISYSARVFAAVEKEIQTQINTSPKRHQRMKNLLGPKVKKESKSSYENQLVQNMANESTRNPLLWNNIGIEISIFRLIFKDMDFNVSHFFSIWILWCL